MAQVRNRNLIAVEKIMRAEIIARDGAMPPLEEIAKHGQKVVNSWDTEFAAPTVTYLWRNKRVCVCYTQQDPGRDSIMFRIVVFTEDGIPLTDAAEFQTRKSHGNSKPSSQTSPGSTGHPDF